MRRAAFAAGALPFAGNLVSACSPTAPSGQTSGGPTAAPAAAKAASGPKKDLVFVEGTDISVLDPMMVTDTPSNGPCLLIYDGLVTFDKDMKVVPVLATGWEISEDKKTWTFKLRPSVKFSNGAPFTSKSIQYTWERMADTATASPARTQYSIVDHVEAQDDLTVKFVTKAQFPDLLLTLARPTFLPYEPVTTKHFALNDSGRNPTGAGP